jgi:MoxR-like ATPase
MLKVLVGYPRSTEEFVIVERMTGALADVQQVIDPEQLLQLQEQVDQVYADPALMEYSVKLVTSTRQPASANLAELDHYIMYGASPRASINIILAARALAFLRERDYVLPPDVRDIALDVMRHRLVLSYEALSDNVTSDDILNQIVDEVRLPKVPLNEFRRPN